MTCARACVLCAYLKRNMRFPHTSIDDEDEDEDADAADDDGDDDYDEDDEYEYH